MPHFIAMTSRGLEPALEEELTELGFDRLKKVSSGIEFNSNWEGCYRANMSLRSATRILLPVLDFPAYQADDLYNNLRRHDFTKYIDPDQTLAVEANVRLNAALHDQRFVAQRVKDAVVDQFRERYGRRPNVDAKNPDLKIFVRIVKSSVSVAIDTSGESLVHRGYRRKSVMAPLREHLAAGLLRLADWTPEMALVDPMCGSGTILIEAAMRAKGLEASALRAQFGFERLKIFQPEAWQKVKASSLPKKLELKRGPIKLFGFDHDPQAISAARMNAKEAGVERLINFKVGDIRDLKRPCETGMLIVNPPYGERLSLKENIPTLYKELAATLKREFTGWTCWLLSGDEEATKALHLKTNRRIRVYNGTIECRFLRYDLFTGKGPE